MTDNLISNVVKDFIRDSSRRALLDIGKNIDSLRSQYVDPKPVVIDIPKPTQSEVQQVQLQPSVREIIRETTICRKPKTDVISKRGYAINNHENVLNIEGRAGTLRELVLVSPIQFDININVDGSIVTYYNTDFNDLQTMYQYSNTFIATQSLAGDFIINVKKIYFLKKIKVDVIVNGRTVFKNIFAVIDTEEEICSR
ncbi:MAG: hypothetical protein O8C67_04985 [Candidatus Methanoperedens sp.]|nr:hypothetical protein [Candidatus Methanoperedens sp.]